jgi:hypothetical protein
MDFDPNTEVDWFNQVTSYTECLYDYRQSTEFIIHADLDDLILPRHNFHLPTELSQLAARYPDAASIEFQWATAKVRTCKLSGNFGAFLSLVICFSVM